MMNLVVGAEVLGIIPGMMAVIIIGLLLYFGGIGLYNLIVIRIIAGTIRVILDFFRDIIHGKKDKKKD